MKQYIDKDIIIGEIDRVLNSYDPNEITSGRYALADLRDFINTLEVKEVNLEKETKKIYLQYRRYCGNKNMLVVLNELQFNDIAKYFIELGLNVRKENSQNKQNQNIVIMSAGWIAFCIIMGYILLLCLIIYEYNKYK